MKLSSFLATISLLGTGVALNAQDKPAPKAPTAQPTEAKEIDPVMIKKDSSYALGFNSGSGLRRNAVQPDDLDAVQFVKGLLDSINGKEPSGGQEKLQKALTDLQQLLRERDQKLGEENLAKGLAFLEENGKREGVVTTESGMQYEIITAGEGEVYNSEDKNVKFLCNYRGTLIDGTEFDKSPEGKPVPLTLNTVPGFKEAITTMPVGSKWKIFLKPELAYGERRRGEKIAPNSTLIFDLELVELQKPAPRPRAVSKPIQIPPRPKKSEDAATEKATSTPAAKSEVKKETPPQKAEAAVKEVKIESPKSKPPVQVIEVTEPEVDSEAVKKAADTKVAPKKDE